MNAATTPRQIEVLIMGQSYVLTAPADGETTLREAVERVDEAMCRIRDAGKIRARDRIAVLAALNMAFEPVAEAQQADDPRLTALIERLDKVLSQDGRLI